MKTSNAKLVNKIFLIGSLALTTSWSVSTQAGSAAANMELSTDVVANCTITADALTVSGYDPIVVNKTTDFDQTSNVTVTCTKDSAVNITLGDGGNTGRRLKYGTDQYLDYELYQDAGHVNVWGNTELNRVSATGTGLADIHPVYIRVPANQNVPAGTYTDTVVATVTF